MTRHVPDETMYDVRVVHDAVGSYADWLIVKDAKPWRTHDYLLGKRPPNYPVPAIPLTVETWHDTVGIFAWNNPNTRCGKITAAFVK